MDEPTYSIVIPVFNEKGVIVELFRRLKTVIGQLDGPAEVIFVDDASDDGSYALLVEMSGIDARFKVLRFSRNFGHQIAITAGIDAARGKAIVMLDADLQDPPEVMLDLAKQWREGYDIVYAVREKRDGETWFKLATAAMFYKLLRKLTDVDIPENVGDFRLVDRKAVDAFKAMRENNRFVRGMFSWVGFKQIGVPYKRAQRYAGETHYPFRRMLKLATNAILSFSDVPLRLTMSVGFIIAAVSFLFAMTWVILKVFNLAPVGTVQGWPTLVVLVSFLGGVQLMVLGIMGQYLARIYQEVQRRPLYLISESHGMRTRETGILSREAMPMTKSSESKRTPHL